MKRALSAEIAAVSGRLETIRRRLRSSRRLLRLWKFLLEKAADPETNLQAAARCVGMHKDHLNATLKRTAGVTFGQLLSLLRIRRVLRLMQRRQLPLAQICYESGFNSQTTFWRHFRRHVGCPPSQWRAIIREAKRSSSQFSDSVGAASEPKSRKLK